MNRRVFFFIILSVVFMVRGIIPGKAQTADTTFYLITCGPGTETYSIYGHSALRVVTPTDDIVFNWGVFDFDTPNFAWKFAKGRLNYMLAYEPFENFLRSYFFEERYVLVQKINLEPAEKLMMLDLIRENLKPENIKYRYDFFYDDCSTRIRDLIERSVTGSIIYPAEVDSDIPTFRQMIDKYQHPYPWLDFGIDLLLGMPSDKKADVRDRMFLPIDMMEGLSETTLYRDGQNVRLLDESEVVLDFDPPLPAKKIPGPFIIFSAIFFLLLLFSLFMKKPGYLNVMDITIYFIFALISILLVFFNFFTDHDQVKWNFNMIWISPLIILCFFSVLFNRQDQILFRLVFIITAAFVVVHLLMPQEFNVANYPLILILLMRTSARSGFKWNPLSIPGNIYPASV